jgi:hypothetical protein
MNRTLIYGATCLLSVTPCASLPPAPPTTLPEDCPAILIQRTDGLVPEPESGVIAAVWSDGTVVRTQSRREPTGGYVVGILLPTDLAELLALAHSDEVWNVPRSFVALDTPGEELLIKVGDERRGWGQARGLTATPSIHRVRDAILAVSLQRPTEFRDRLKREWACPPTTWK